MRCQKYQKELEFIYLWPSILFFASTLHLLNFIIIFSQSMSVTYQFISSQNITPSRNSGFPNTSLTNRLFNATPRALSACDINAFQLFHNPVELSSQKPLRPTRISAHGQITNWSLPGNPQYELERFFHRWLLQLSRSPGKEIESKPDDN